MIREIQFSKLSIRDMFRLYNEHAEKIGRPCLRPMPKDKVEMARALAVILTYRAKPGARPATGKPPTEREIIIEELCKISHYEHRDTGNKVEGELLKKYPPSMLVPVGFTYAEVLVTIRTRCPKTKCTPDMLRVYATYVRQGHTGYEKNKLPKRPYSNKGKKIK